MGLYYEFLRWCDPFIGRFIARDPLPGGAVSPQSLNPYVFVRNVPTILVDPTGAADCYEGRLCEGPAYGRWSSSDVRDYIKTKGITDPVVIENCLDNPAECPMELRVKGYDPENWDVTTPDTTSPSTSDTYGSSDSATAVKPPTINTNPTATSSAISESTNIPPSHLYWAANVEGMSDFLGEQGTPVPDTAYTPGRGKMVWEIRPDPGMRIVGEQHPNRPDFSTASQAWHWHVEPGHYWGILGLPCLTGSVKTLTAGGYL